MICRATSFVLILIPSIATAQPITEPAAKYAEAVKVLEGYIAREVEEKRLPAFSIALVDDQKIVWARGFGFADAERKRPATADTVYRFGSVSKLFTDIAIMQLVEQGKLDLDVPITKYLPEFKPKSPLHKPITLRNLMSHHSGLVREPPVGSYFHDEHPTLAKLVESLNDTTLVYEPGKRMKYSNAALAVAAYAMEKTQGQPFADLVKKNVLDALGMTRSDFKLRDDLKKDLAEAVLWTYHGTESKAPTFETGNAPAGGLYSTVNDLGKFISAMFANGKSVLKPEALNVMMTPQFAGKDAKAGIGIGFFLAESNGNRFASHTGAMQGHIATLDFMPDQKLGVVVVASRDLAIATISGIRAKAFEHMLAVKEKRPLPKLVATERLDSQEAKQLAGWYAFNGRIVELVESAGRLYRFPEGGGFRVEVRKQAGRFVTDDVLGYGFEFTRTDDGKNIREGKNEGVRVPIPPPVPASDHFLGLIGEYGSDHCILLVHEKKSKLHATAGGLCIEPLKEITKDEYVFSETAFPFDGERAVFKRDAKGKASEVRIGGVVFKRRHIDGEDGKTFRIKPLKGIAELRTIAEKATPPEEKGKTAKFDLVDVTQLDKGIATDLRYATDNNFMSTPLYPKNAKAYLQRPAAEALVKINLKLKKHSYGLLIHDAYRPWTVTKMFWDATPEKWHHFVADPSQGSRHNRGCAVDLTLCSCLSGAPIEMVGGFDEFSDRSYPDYIGGTSLQRWNRDILRQAMEEAGFTVYEAEWWHFDWKDWRQYPIGNQSFDELERKK